VASNGGTPDGVGVGLGSEGLGRGVGIGLCEGTGEGHGSDFGQSGQTSPDLWKRLFLSVPFAWTMKQVLGSTYSLRAGLFPGSL